MDILAEIIKQLGIVAIPIVIVGAVVYQLFQILKERDKKMEIIVSSFNKTIQEHLNGNSRMIDQMIKSFEVWRETSSKEHSSIIDNQIKLMNKMKVK